MSVKIENGKLILEDRANPNSNRHVEIYYENGDLKIVEVQTTKQEKVLSNINFNEG